MKLQEEIMIVLNQHCAENKSDTPDFILAQFLIGCLKSFDKAVVLRDQWYGFKSMSKGGKNG
jgi:hypothetical protein